MIAKDVVLSTGGFVIKSPFTNEKKREMTNKPSRINIGFMASATSSMINDKPDTEDVRKDIMNLKFIPAGKDKGYSLADYIIERAVRANLSIIKEYFTVSNAVFDCYKTELRDFKITSLSKCGALIENNAIKQFRLMNINDSHILEFDRDFIGYSLYFSFMGRLIFFYRKKEIEERINFNFTKIPLMSFKSENAFKNELNRKIATEMLMKFSGSNIETIFV